MQKSVIFWKIDKVCNPGNSEHWHTGNSGIFRTLTYLRNPLKDLIRSVLRKQLKAIIISPKRPILDLWQDSKCIHLSISTHELVERPHAMYCIKHNQNSVYFSKFNHIQVYSGPIQTYQTYCGIVKTLCNSCIFRTLPQSESGHIQKQRFIRTLSTHTLVYSERCVTFAQSEPCHIQNFDIFRILAYLGPEAYSEYCFIRHIQVSSIMIVVIKLTSFFSL